MEKDYIILYKKENNDKTLLSKCKATNWTMAMDKAEKCIKFMESKLNCKYSLISVNSIEAIESWD